MLNNGPLLLIGWLAIVIWWPLAMAQPAPFDTVIANGRVMDPGSGRDAVLNVGIRDGRIAELTSEPISAATVIDAAGHIVAPGFIDTHYHGTLPLHYRIAARNGVTTAMDLEYGTLGPRVDEWYAMREGNSLINFGTGSSHELARAHVLDGADSIDTSEASVARSGPNWSGTVLNKQQMTEVADTIRAGFDGGAIAFSSTLGYMPGATGEEFYRLQALATASGRITSVHLRHTPGTATEQLTGAQEVLANAAALGGSAIINHFNNKGWASVYRLIRDMQGQGFNVWGELYPYGVGSTTINAVFLDPTNHRERLGLRYEETIYDPAVNRFLTEEEFLALRSEDPTHVILIHKMPASDVPKWLALPGVAIASDGIPPLGVGDIDADLGELPNVHPRAAGTYAKALRLAREHDMDLMSVLAQTSWVPASGLAQLGLASMAERGRVQRGAVADLVVFDPDTVTDHSTYANGNQLATGFKAVLVAGELIVEDDREMTYKTPGQPIRFSVSGP